ncbi:unnamed protein product [Symbiodinium sp. CCMP2592]|nr:unnamed protein product [Symbiodinium sp. CCMP2592]
MLDVVIVGAGISGISCAKHIRASDGMRQHRIKVLEATDRTGRAKTVVQKDGSIVDWGTTWIHGGPGNVIHDFATEKGLMLDKDWMSDPKWQWEVLPLRHLHGSEASPAEKQAFDEMEKAFDGFTEKEAVGDQADEKSLGALLDEEFQKWAQQKEHDAGMMQTMFEFKKREMSSGVGSPDLYTASANGFVQAEDGFGHDCIPLPHGYSSIVRALLEEVPDLDVQYDAAVKEVTSHDNHVEITLENGDKLQARTVVFTVSVGVLKSGQIRFKPELPQEKQEAIQRMGFGHVEKCILTFDSDTWETLKHGVHCLWPPERDGYRNAVLNDWEPWRELFTVRDVGPSLNGRAFGGLTAGRALISGARTVRGVSGARTVRGRGQGAGARYRVHGRCAGEGGDKGRERDIGCADGAHGQGAGARYRVCGRCAGKGGDKGRERDIGCADGAQVTEQSIVAFYPNQPRSSRSLVAWIVADGFSNTSAPEKVMNLLRRCLGRDIPDPVETNLTNWGRDRRFLGSWSYLSAGQPLDAFGMLGKPFGRVFFGGEHTHPKYFGTAHGAYESGARCAQEVIDALSRWEEKVRQRVFSALMSLYRLLPSHLLQARAGTARLNASSFVPDMGVVAARAAEPEARDGQYDYVIVGGGSAGCVVASRLSEDPTLSVLLIEAGGGNQDWAVQSPFFGCARLPHSDRDWKYETVEQEVTGGRSHHCPRGKLLGGCSSINSMVWVRGDPRTFDDWEKRLHCKGWGWKDVLPYFRKSEQFNGPDPHDLRGSGGPIQVSDASRGELASEPTCQLFLDACSQCGIPTNPDYNGLLQEGAAMVQANVKDGLRYDTATAYLYKTGAMNRQNLTVLTESLATRVVLEGKRASAVMFQRRGAPGCARARCEVVLCCGAIATPQLLMLSGIGPKAHLTDVGIECEVDLPVGENLQDHVMWEMKFQAKRPMHFNPARPFSLAFGLWQYPRGTGVFSFPPVTAVAFTQSKTPGSMPERGNDVQFHMLPFFLSEFPFTSLWPKIPARQEVSEGILLFPTLLLTRSRGRLWLRSKSPSEHPALDPCYLKDMHDIQVGIAAHRMAREVVNAPAFQGWLESEVLDPLINHPPDSEEYIAEYIRRHANTVYHHCGTARMGCDGDTEAVLDLKLRVCGVSGLRVADASVMPGIVTANINAAVIMIGERAAHFIRERA